jgi:hypothetical protein
MFEAWAKKTLITLESKSAVAAGVSFFAVHSVLLSVHFRNLSLLVLSVRRGQMHGVFEYAYILISP